MPRFDDGNATMMAWDYILDLDVSASDIELPGKEYIDQLDDSTVFRDAINERINVLGYCGNMDDPKQKADFILHQFQKHEIEPVGKGTLENWMKSTAPKADSRGRENVFKLCFALEMNAVETAEFMLKAFLTRPFNYKNTKEAVYFFCLINGKSYNDALHIIECIENNRTSESKGNVYTEQIGSAIANMRHEEDLISYLTEHYYTEQQWHYSAVQKINDLLEKCFALAKNDEANQRIIIDTKTDTVTTLADPVKSVDRLLDVIYDYDAYEMKQLGERSINKSPLPKTIKQNWIDRQAFHNIFKGTKVSDEVYRKALIILEFYNFYSDLYQKRVAKLKTDEGIDLRDCADEFEMALDELLAECGYVQIYKRNPFDWFILYCASFPNPIEQFRAVLYQYLFEE